MRVYSSLKENAMDNPRRLSRNAELPLFVMTEDGIWKTKQLPTTLQKPIQSVRFLNGKNY